MKVFVINSGSSSIKYQLFEMPSAKTICSGLVERIGLNNSVITHKIFTQGTDEIVKENLDLNDHAEGLKEVKALLTDPDYGVIQNPEEIEAVGHRVVHGGEQFAVTTAITPAVKEQIKKLFPLAPLHNPANYVGIEVAEKIFTSAQQVAVFDTAFHQTMSEKAYRIAIPNEFYLNYGIRAYGFHGTSHKYVSEQAAIYLGKKDAKIITIHLGNGCSMTAINAGKCIDTSMGLGPMNGLIMGTRCGDIDQSVIFHLVNQLGYDLDQVNTILNKKSGMIGLTGFSDMRDITLELEKGSHDAKIAYEMYAYRIQKYIGMFTAVLNGLDAIVFTAGVGENDALIRKMASENLDYLGIQIDEEKNKQRVKGIREINQSDSRVKILIIPTNEELEIAKECYTLLSPK
ncbi:acetate/propionate family kinase [Solitalea lacus]|uniref:acetate/propionate family kinase n=1 Tax=Solitalea lacus TaxID=2911172 RepID=UPI001EDC2243|nr:acetate kinase [Solitalea lacus]UKJ09084.1 acetate kinase [Solitalea lacus]